MERWASGYHFDNEGMSFGEAWHKRFTGNLFASRPDWAGGGSVPFPTPIPQGEDDMGVLFGINNADSPTAPGNYWALAGTSPGTPANWLEISDSALANQLAANTKSGNYIFLSRGTWDVWKKAYLSPLLTDEIEAVPPATPPKA